MRRPARMAWISLAAALLLAACTRVAPPEQSGELVVAVRADPVFFQKEGPDGDATGLAHDLALQFGQELGLKVRFVVAKSEAELLDLVRQGKAHFAVAVPAIQGAVDLRYTPPFRESRLVVVQNADALPHDDLASLAGQPIEVLPGSPELQSLRQATTDRPLTPVEVAGSDDLGLLGRVADRRAEFAATDSLHFDVAANYYPNLDVAVELPQKAAYVWAFRDQDTALLERATDFLARVRADGTLARLDDRYFGHINRLNANGIEQFMHDVQSVLPRFAAAFRQAQTITGIDWRLLAALSYQESKWDPLATSPTGVRGLMMLTEDTADRMGVSNRLDPLESIRAAAEYLADIRDDLPDEIREPDRTWLALAGYNLGAGHLNGARQFAVGMKRDADSWYDMKRVLPLMARPEYYSRLKSGRARGGEAVIMVENIRSYYDILRRVEPTYAGLSFSRPPT
jgi:membrane-bound lytic murein transglycosylase F